MANSSLWGTHKRNPKTTKQAVC